MVLVAIAEGWEGAAPYRDMFEALASHTMAMIANRKAATQEIPQTPALLDISEQDALAGWIAEIDSMGMLDGFDGLLSGFMDDFTPS
ncbi:hypothetical protein AUP68_08431 [Ilyonectria robusta]